jgi:bifunctional DNase/RNase
MDDQVPMEIIGVRVELPTNTPILLLRERDGSRYLPIWIGTPEATAIALALEGVETARPLTHDLLRTIVEALGADVEQVNVTGLDDGIFFADLIISTNGDELTISSRPSDAIALATRTGSPVYASKALLDEAGVEIHDESEEQQIEQFKEFLDEINPEDFESPAQS